MTVTIRVATTADIPGIARVHCESWRTTYTGLIGDATLARMTDVERRTAQWEHTFSELRPEEGAFVAEQEGEIVGFVHGGKNRAELPDYDSELYAIYLLETAQGQGIGRGLMLTLARHLAAQGFGSMALWVLRENDPSRRFYERMGGVFVKEMSFSMGDETLNEVAYGYVLKDLLNKIE